MPAERIIAVDFGTSTSVIRVKRYLNGHPMGDRLETKAVTFNMGSSMAPTLIQKKQDTKESVYFGHGAEIARRGTETLRNFKVDIESSDPEIREQARSLTAEFFGFLAKIYHDQSKDNHLGESDDKERTIISYPVKWSDETKDFMIKTAQAAGFPNVEGMDEAQAAIQAVMALNADQLKRKGYFQAGIATNILLIDMGAGTTDLVLCQYTPGNQPKTNILATWPKENGISFGGQEADDLLKDYICATMPGIVRKKLQMSTVKGWKETVVSPALAQEESVDYFSALDDLLSLLDIDADYMIDRLSLEDFAKDYLKQLPELVNGCLDAAGMKGDEVDLVILTGGHSQWYFVREILSGKLGQFGDVGLTKIQTDPKRIVSTSLPQETVALGLAYQGLEFCLPPEPLIFIKEVMPTCQTQGHIAYWYRDSDGACFADEAETQPLTKADMVLSSLSHNFEWTVQGQERVEVCARCGATGRRERIAGAAPRIVVNPKEFCTTPESEFKFIITRSGSRTGCWIKRYIGTRKHVVIPEQIQGATVFGIGTGSLFSIFEDFDTLGTESVVESVVIPSTVAVIGESAFARCTHLNSVVAHKNIEVIDKWAFCGCRNLVKMDFGMGNCPPKTFKFPPMLKSIGASAFSYLDDDHSTQLSIPREVWLSRKTALKSEFGMNKPFGKKSSYAMFYYK